MCVANIGGVPSEAYHTTCPPFVHKRGFIRFLQAPYEGAYRRRFSESQGRRAAFSGTPVARKALLRKPSQSMRQVVVAAAKQISVDIEKPVGLAFKESKAAGGGLVVTVRFVFVLAAVCHVFLETFCCRRSIVQPLA